MKKAFSIILVFIMIIVLFPTKALAASASFSIAGPSTLGKGEMGTYVVKVTVSDASGAQATLYYDSNFFELVSGNLKGEWDTSNNTNTTATLITVTLKCKADIGSSGSLSLTEKKTSRLTGGDPPVESVPCSGGSKTVTNPIPAPPSTETPQQTKKPKTTAKPTGTVEPDSSPSPSITPAEPVIAQDPWAFVDGNIADTLPGGRINAQIQNNTQMPMSVLKHLKDKQGILQINFGDYSCTINGSDINNIPEDLSAIDLLLNMDKDETLSQAAGGDDVYQLHFSYHGDLPGKFTYTIKAKDSKPGDTVYLYYYYDKAGVIEGMQSAVVDENGYLTFNIYHCSSYFISDKIINGAMNNFTKVYDIITMSLLVLIICIAGAALISAFAVMFFFKVGLFKVKEEKQ